MSILSKLRQLTHLSLELKFTFHRRNLVRDSPILPITLLKLINATLKTPFDSLGDFLEKIAMPACQALVLRLDEIPTDSDVDLTAPLMRIRLRHAPKATQGTRLTIHACSSFHVDIQLTPAEEPRPVPWCGQDSIEEGLAIGLQLEGYNNPDSSKLRLLYAFDDGITSLHFLPKLANVPRIPYFGPHNIKAYLQNTTSITTLGCDAPWIGDWVGEIQVVGDGLFSVARPSLRVVPTNISSMWRSFLLYFVLHSDNFLLFHNLQTTNRLEL